MTMPDSEDACKSLQNFKTVNVFIQFPIRYDSKLLEVTKILDSSTLCSNCLKTVFYSETGAANA